MVEIAHLRATSHTLRLTLARAWALALLLLAAPACSPDVDEGSAASVKRAEPTPAEIEAAEARIQALRATFTPIDPTSTSDKVCTWRENKRLALEEAERGGPALSVVALRAFHAETDASDEWRSALLSIASRTDPEHARPTLEALSLTYDGVNGLGVRNEAVRLLCQTSPAAAVDLFEPILRQQRSSVTYPPKEQMLSHWVAAARAIGRPIDGALAQIATDIAQPADTRYVAVEALAKEGASAIARKALETVLVESGSDGMLRRKAAQSMREALPKAEMCAILQRVSERESDPAFLNFLADMLIKNCS